MAKLSILALVLLASCIPMTVAPEVKVQEEGSQPGSLLYLPFNPWVMDVEHESFYGKGFIANGRIYSARHIFDQQYGASELHGPINGEDVIDLGPAGINGYEICKECRYNEMFFVRKKNKVIFLECTSDNEHNTLWMWSSQEIKEGDSGSPVLCVKHYKVVGLISCYRVGDKFSTLITKMP